MKTPCECWHIAEGAVDLERVHVSEFSQVISQSVYLDSEVDPATRNRTLVKDRNTNCSFFKSHPPCRFGHVLLSVKNSFDIRSLYLFRRFVITKMPVC